MKILNRYFLIAYILSNLIISHGCMSVDPVKPNIPYNGTYPLEFNDLKIDNPLLAHEIGKLPEIQDGISENDTKVIKKICTLYNSHRKSFDNVFKQMYDVGIMKSRKYCSPLQALYWIIEDDKFNKMILENYSLKNILNIAWWSTGFDFNDDKKRWVDFLKVTERLNSPQLINFYQQRAFSYHIFSKSEYCCLNQDGNRGPPPKIIFNRKIGSCSFYTSFAVYCLKIAGYHAKPITGKTTHQSYHRVCEYVDKDGKSYIMDNGRRFPVGIKLKDYYIENYFTDFFVDGYLGPDRSVF